MFDPDDRLPSRGATRLPGLLPEQAITPPVEADVALPAIVPLTEASVANPLAELQKTFPHVAQHIMALWGHKDLDDYLSQLTLMDRQGRSGFPAQTLKLILAIWQHVQGASSEELAASPWLADARMTKQLKKVDADAGSRDTGLAAPAVAMRAQSQQGEPS